MAEPEETPKVPEVNIKSIPFLIATIVNDIVIQHYPDFHKENLETLYTDYLEETVGAGVRMLFRCAIQEDLMARYPADWWQAVKERWMPKWLLRFSPVKYKKVIRRHKFPHLKLPKEIGREYVVTITQNEAKEK